MLLNTAAVATAVAPRSAAVAALRSGGSRSRVRREVWMTDERWRFSHGVVGAAVEFAG